MHPHDTPLMIILIVYIQDITFFQSKGDAPIYTIGEHYRLT